MGRHFSSVFILLSFMLCQCNVMTLLNNLSGTGTWPCKRHHGHCMIPPLPLPLPLPLPSSTGVDSRLQLLACGLYLRLMARTSFGPAQPQHCPHYCWQGMHGLPKCGSALVTMLLLVCLAGPSTSGRPASSTPWGWESARAPPRAVSFQQYLPSFAWIRGISQIPDQGSKLRGAEGQNAPKLSPNAPRLLNLGAKFCYPIQPDICFEA